MSFLSKIIPKKSGKTPSKGTQSKPIQQQAMVNNLQIR
jgi:hypothetical protein